MTSGAQSDSDEDLNANSKSFESLAEELRHARREIDVLRLTSQDSTTSEWEMKILSRSNSTEDVDKEVDLALELEMSKLQLKESQDAQDLASKRLAEYIGIVQQARQRVAQAEHERRAMGLLVQGWKTREEAAESERARLARRLEETENERNALELELARIKESKDNRGHEKDGLEAYKSSRWSPLITTPLLGSLSTPSLPSLSSFDSATSTTSDTKELVISLNRTAALKLRDYPTPEDMRSARNKILGSLPVPDAAPDDSLEPFIIPPPFTLAEFIGSSSKSLGPALHDYRIFHETTTFWCSESEEHGYLLTPLYKCITNPKMQIIHRWYECDTLGNLASSKPCFFNKDQRWYYAGTYAGLQLAHLTPKEWDELGKEAKSALLKETLSGRRNISPQVIYEAGQLYSSGALKIACIGLRCVGFEQGLYQKILAQAKLAQNSGHWSATWD